MFPVPPPRRFSVLELNHRRTIRAAVERIEPRVLLAAAPFASLNSAGTLSVVGTSGNDTIQIRISGSSVVATRNGSSLSFSSSQVKRLWVDPFGGNDTVRN